MNRLIVQYFAKRLLWWAAVIIPFAAAVLWTTMPALEALIATTRIPVLEIEEADWISEEPLLDQRRATQKSLLVHNLYVPMSDIVLGVPPENFGLAVKDVSLFMQKACGTSTLYVWIPLKFRFPLFGDIVWEWCWKPPITKKRA